MKFLITEANQLVIDDEFTIFSGFGLVWHRAVSIRKLKGKAIVEIITTTGAKVSLPWKEEVMLTNHS